MKAVTFIPRCGVICGQKSGRGRMDTVSVLAPFEVGPFVLEPEGRRVWYHGRSTVLTSKQFRLFERLAHVPNRFVLHEAIYSHLYRGKAREPDWKIIRVMVCKIRKKLRDELLIEADLYLVTVWGLGYEFQPQPPILSADQVLNDADTE